MSHATILNSTVITAPQYPSAGTDTVNRALTPKRARPVTGNDAYAASAHRILAAHARRIAGGDVDSLSLLTGLSADIDAAIQAEHDAGPIQAPIPGRDGPLRRPSR
jgi:hypothetical protein